MNPIINPLWFYLVDLVGNAEVIFAIIMGLCVIAVVVLAIIYGSTYDVAYPHPTDDELKLLKSIFNWIKQLIILFVISALFVVAIPSQKTIYTMIIADNITPNNISIVGETLEDTIDYIVDKVDVLLEDGSTDSE